MFFRGPQPHVWITYACAPDGFRASFMSTTPGFPEYIFTAACNAGDRRDVFYETETLGAARGAFKRKRLEDSSHFWVRYCP